MSTHHLIWNMAGMGVLIFEQNDELSGAGFWACAEVIGAVLFNGLI
jgi:hypothetical protein